MKPTIPSFTAPAGDPMYTLFDQASGEFYRGFSLEPTKDVTQAMRFPMWEWAVAERQTSKDAGYWPFYTWRIGVLTAKDLGKL
jgi:hypothetical protein